ncbi:MAG: hypothetical protein ACI9ES_003255 [Oceanospirillaceae bacterium]|jgi:hypothetical protein
MSLKFISKRLVTITCALIIAAFSTFSFAIEPFQATYIANIKSKIDFNGTLVRSLTKEKNGQWLLKDNISSFLASIEESSQLKISGNSIQPQNYHYLRKVLGKKKKRDITFNWAQKKAVNRDNKTFSLLTNTQDRLSYQLQLQMDLQRGQRGNFSYPVAKKDSIDTMKFIELGTEIISTPIGNLKSIKLKLDRGANAKRETYIWFSTEHNFVISQLLQIETDGQSYSIVLNKLS